MDTPQEDAPPLNTPREINEKGARLGYLPCDFCGKDIEVYWAGQPYGDPFILSSPDWDKPGIRLRCQDHIAL